MIILTEINDAILQEIKDVYGSADLSVVETVVNDILSRYLSSEYMINDLETEQSWETPIDESILNDISETFTEMFKENGVSDEDAIAFDKIDSLDQFVITSYAVGRIYALVETYTKITGHPPTGDIGKMVELLTTYDLFGGV